MDQENEVVVETVLIEVILMPKTALIPHNFTDRGANLFCKRPNSSRKTSSMDSNYPILTPK